MPAIRALHGETVRGEMLVLKRPDRTYWLSTSAAPIIDADGHRLGAILTATDVSELHAMQEQMTTFLHMVSHDLRQPLTVTQGHVDLLNGCLVEHENPLAQTCIAAIGRAVKRMDVMIDDLAEAARLEGGQLPVKPQPVVLTDYLPDFLARNAGVLHPDRMHLATSVPVVARAG